MFSTIVLNLSQLGKNFNCLYNLKEESIDKYSRKSDLLQLEETSCGVVLCYHVSGLTCAINFS